MWGSIIAAIISIAGSSISAGVSGKQQREAQEEARGLAEIQRGDILKQRKEEEKMARKSLALGEDRLAQDRFMAQQSAKAKEEEMKSAKQSYRRGKITQAAQNLQQEPAESFLFKRRNVERFSI